MYDVMQSRAFPGQAWGRRMCISHAPARTITPVPPWAPSHNCFKELAAATPQGTIRIPQSRIPSMEHYLSAERVTVAHKRKCFWPARCPSRRSVNAFSPSGPSACTCDDVPDPKLFAVFTFVLARLRHQSACGAVVRTPPRGHACQAKFCWAPHAQ